MIEETLNNIKGVSGIKDFYEENKQNINIAGIILILLFGAGYYYFKMYKPAQEKEAYGQLFMAERYFRSDSTDKALNGDGNFLGMIDIAADYGSTKAGNLASYYAGRLLLDKGQYQEALDYFNDVSFSDEIMPAMILALKGDCNSELGDYATAASLYLDAASKKDNNATPPYALKKAAFASEAASELDDAVDAWTELRTEYFESDEAQDAEKHIARLQTMIAAQ